MVKSIKTTPSPLPSRIRWKPVRSFIFPGRAFRFACKELLLQTAQFIRLITSLYLLFRCYFNRFRCFDCHFKSYCSYDCKILDKKLHKFECIGYKLLILPMLKCELLFRLLIECLVLLKESVFYRHQIR